MRNIGLIFLSALLMTSAGGIRLFAEGDHDGSLPSLQTPPAEQEEKSKRENEEKKRKEEQKNRDAHDEGEAAKPDTSTTPTPAPAGDDKEKKEDKWDVSNPSGPWYDAKIETDEGTWINVDVSPDGKEVIFDLLGDIYVIPMGGGKARALTSGIPWDTQPRFSPNGRWIAFTSDRSGGDNAWIMKRDGKDPIQVTKETFRLVNSPVWTPDSNFLAVRKHFTSTRSAGAGEIWLFHRSGGEGLQLTKKPNEQKDVGEPAFAPDGRYIYYSQDITPGSVFEYNKDPNGEIYNIQRLDRDTGETVAFITGPGGAIRPVPSRDGKQIAYIRRVRTRSVLHVQDVQSGAERPIYDALDRDMQETWAIHGVYPNFAWTPDNRSIVFWSGGKIRRIDVASKQVSEIPFTIADTRKVQEALRFPVQVAPERFDVRMLRWVEVSPNGRQVLYQALGKIYIRDLPNGTPRRLTKQSDHQEYCPSFSRDGQWIVYTTWDDERLGSVRVASSGGGVEKALTSTPGHYLEPRFSPDGSKVVFRKAAGGFLRSARWSREPGLYFVSSRGGGATRIISTGIAPQFGNDDRRVFFTTIEAEDKRALRSIELDGSDERTHFLTDHATEFRVSPDGQWLAFTERFNAYIAPLIYTGKTVDIGPDTKAVPLSRVSKDAGEYLHWSGDSKRLYWALGPQLYSRELREAFAFMEGAPEKLPDAPLSGVNIGFQQKSDLPEGKIALSGARLITMRGDEVIEDGVIVVDRNRIVSVGRRDSITIPSDAKRIDVSGKTIMPGLIDVHWHGAQGTDEIIPEENWVNYASLAFGVTTIHDPSNDTSTIFSASEMARAGLTTAPRTFSTGTILYGAKAPFKAVIETLDDAVSTVRRMKAVGAFSVKSYNQPRRDQRQKVITAARELGMMVVPEGGSLFPHNMNMIVDGHTGIEHSIPVARIYKDVRQLWSQSRTYYTPTLVVGYGGIFGENYWYQYTNVWEDERLAAFVPREIVDQRSRRRVMAPEEEYNHFNNARIAHELNQLGVPVQVGAHGQREGLAAHWEVWMLEQGGMTRLEALRAATMNGARYLGMDKDLGSLEPGKLADLIVISKNPLDDIRNSASVTHTMVNGRLYDAATMNEIGTRNRTRQSFFFERERQ